MGRDKEGVIPAQLRTSFTQKGFNPGSIWKWGQREDSRKTSLKMSHKTFPTQTHMKIINEGILKVDITVGGLSAKDIRLCKTDFVSFNIQINS